MNINELDHKTLIAYYWQAGFLYEHHDDSFLTDGEWDALCLRLLNEWDSLPDTEHKRKIVKEDLSSATASGHTLDKVPQMAQHAALKRLQEFKRKKR
jgi:hypothetical protein